MIRAGLAALLVAAAGTALGGAPDGGQPAAWLKLGVGARELAMGRVGVALGDDAYAFHYNPATLGTLESLHMGSQASLLPGDRSLEFLSLARPVRFRERGYAWGISYTRFSLNAPVEYRVHNTPEPEKTFLAADNAVVLGLAGWSYANSLSVGLNLRVISSQLGEATATGISGDLGALWRFNPRMQAGISFQDVAGRMSWNTGLAESFPLTVRAGVSARPLEWALASLDLEKGSVQDFRIRVGAEFQASRFFAVRLGMNHQLWTAGFGLKIPALQSLGSLDYALGADPLEPGALAHRISLNLRFKVRSDHGADASS